MPKGERTLQQDMMRIILYIIIIGLLPYSSFSQDMMSKQEVVSYLIDLETNHAIPLKYNKHLDSSVVDLIGNLRISGIDTIGVYELDLEGYESIDTCNCGSLPWVSYVHWIHNGMTYHQMLTECCEFEPILIESSVILRYYINTKSRIDKEMIFPVIDGFSKDKNGKTIPIMSMSTHSIRHLIYCDINGNSKFIRFGQYEIDHKDNMFYFDNLNSTINSWRKMIENQIEEIEE